MTLNHFRTLFYLTVDPVVILDSNGTVLEITERIEEAIGYTREEIIDKELNELPFLTPEAKQLLLSNLEKRLGGVDIPPYTIELSTRSGGSKTFEVNAKKIGYYGKTAVIAALRDITKRKWYEEKLEALHRHASVLSSADKLEEVAVDTIQVLKDVFGFSRASFSVVKEGVLEVVEADPYTTLWEVPLESKGIVVKAVNSGETQIVPDVRENEDYIDAVPEGENPTLSELAVPVKREKGVVAVINIESEELRAFNEEDAELVEILAEHVSSAIERINYEKRLRALEKYSSELHASSNVEEVTKTTLEFIEEVLGSCRAGIGMVEEDAINPISLSEPRVGRSIKVNDSSVIARAVRTGESQLVPDTRRDEDYIPYDPSEEVIMLSELAVPMKDGGRVIGVINIESKKPDAFGAREKRIMELFSDHVASSITRLKRMEEMERLLQEKTEQLHQIFAASPDPIFLTDLAGNILECNQATLDLTDYSSKDEMVGESGFNFVADESLSVAVKAFQEVITEGMIRGIEFNIETEKMGKIPVEVSARILDDDTGNPRSMIVVFRNIKERKKAQEELKRSMESLEEKTEELRQAYEDLKELDRMKDQFVSMATHELRTPLVSIKGYVDYIQNGSAGEVPEKIRDMLDIVQRNTERLSKITDDLLDQQRIESGQLHIDPEPIQLTKIVEEVVEEAEPMLEERKQKLKIDITDDLPTIDADRTKISQVLINLLSNASKFSPEETTIKLDIKETEEDVTISVEDEGIGLSQEDIDKLFKPFPNIDRPTVTEKSTGLGLSICKGIIELHGGEIWVESLGRGEGSTFKFTLPKT